MGNRPVETIRVTEVDDHIDVVHQLDDAAQTQPIVRDMISHCQPG